MATDERQLHQAPCTSFSRVLWANLDIIGRVKLSLEVSFFATTKLRFVPISKSNFQITRNSDPEELLAGVASALHIDLQALQLRPTYDLHGEELDDKARLSKDDGRDRINLQGLVTECVRYLKPAAGVPQARKVRAPST